MPFIIRLARTRFGKCSMRVSSIASLDFPCSCSLLLRYQHRWRVYSNSAEKQGRQTNYCKSLGSFDFGRFAFSNLSGPSIDHGYIGNGLVTYLLQRGKGKAAWREGFQDLMDEVTDHVELDEVTDLGT